MVNNPMDVTINFVGLAELVPKVCSEMLGWCIDKKGDLKSRILRQNFLTQEVMLGFPQNRDPD